MRDHSVVVDESGTPRGVEFADIFNVSVAFLDRHLEQGRGDKLPGRARPFPDFAQTAETGNRTPTLHEPESGRADPRQLFADAQLTTFLGAARIGAVATPSLFLGRYRSSL